MSRAGLTQSPAFQVVNFPFAVTLMGRTRFSPTLDFIEWAGDGLGWAQRPDFALCLDGN